MPNSTLIGQALALLEDTIPLLPILPGSKKPVANEDGTWDTISPDDDREKVITRLESLQARFHAPLNLAMLLGREKGSPVITVDMDGLDGIEKARELGVSSADPVWAWRTGRGGYQVSYYVPADLVLPPRAVRAGDVALDLLHNGYALIPPSHTVGPYLWLAGHSPSDLSIVDLLPLPAVLLEWWRELTSKPSVPAQGAPAKDTAAYHLLDGPIVEGKRNHTLTRIAGWLRQYHPAPVAEGLLQVINDARCRPPLEASEVAAIIISVFHYPQRGVNGHPRAVVPHVEWVQA